MLSWGEEDFYYFLVTMQDEDGIFLLRRQLCLLRNSVGVIELLWD